MNEQEHQNQEYLFKTRALGCAIFDVIREKYPINNSQDLYSIAVAFYGTYCALLKEFSIDRGSFHICLQAFANFIQKCVSDTLLQELQEFEGEIEK